MYQICSILFNILKCGEFKSSNNELIEILKQCDPLKLQKMVIENTEIFSKLPKDILHCLRKVLLAQREIIKNAQVISQGLRTYCNFSRLPVELSVKIIADTRDSEFFSDKKHGI